MGVTLSLILWVGGPRPAQGRSAEGHTDGDRVGLGALVCQCRHYAFLGGWNTRVAERGGTVTYGTSGLLLRRT